MNLLKRIERRHLIDAALILLISVIIVAYKLVGLQMNLH
jgi:hypothetical protein